MGTPSLTIRPSRLSALVVLGFGLAGVSLAVFLAKAIWQLEPTELKALLEEQQRRLLTAPRHGPVR